MKHIKEILEDVKKEIFVKSRLDEKMDEHDVKSGLTDCPCNICKIRRQVRADMKK